MANEAYRPVWNAVVYAVRSGRVAPQPCEVCGAAKTDAHHDDYSRPLDVRWLCRTHHSQQHGQRGRKRSEVCFGPGRHPRTPENTWTYTKPDGRVVRCCRVCRNAATVRYHAKVKAGSPE